MNRTWQRDVLVPLLCVLDGAAVGIAALHVLAPLPALSIASIAGALAYVAAMLLGWA